jgi:predicted metal-dependent phosphoesterase TrpH
MGKMNRNDMKIDLHIHSKDCSDGKMTLPEIFAEAHERTVKMISITDHDSIECQESAAALAEDYGIYYVPGVELSITFSHKQYGNSKSVSLDVLGYMYNIHDRNLKQKLKKLREYRMLRAERILEKVNKELSKAHLDPLTHKDLLEIQESVDGAFGRPHIADYMVKKGVVTNRQEAFDRYLVRCNVAKMPLSLEEASDLIRNAGGKLMLAHPNNPNGTSLASLTPSIEEQHDIIRETMLPFLDGIECWHPSHDRETVSRYLSLVRKEGLMVSGGSDCHQQPPILGTVDMPPYVAEQFRL